MRACRVGISTSLTRAARLSHLTCSRGSSSSSTTSLMLQSRPRLTRSTRLRFSTFARSKLRRETLQRATLGSPCKCRAITDRPFVMTAHMFRVARQASTGRAAFRAVPVAAQLLVERQLPGCPGQEAHRCPATPGRRLPRQRLQKRGASPPSACYPGQGAKPSPWKRTWTHQVRSEERIALVQSLKGCATACSHLLI